MRGLLMVPVALALVAMVSADAQTTAPARKAGEGKSAQRFTTRSDFGDDDDNTIIIRGDPNNRRFGFGLTPNPTRVVTVTSSPGLGVTGGLGRDQILFGQDDRFNQIYSPGSFFPGNVNGGGIPGGVLGGNVLGGNVLGGGLGFGSNDRYSRYLEILVARDPVILLQNPELLLQYPQLILVRPELLLQYPQLRQYIDPRILNLGPSAFDPNNQQPFRRVFPQSFLGINDNFGGNFGSNFGGGNFGSNFGGNFGSNFNDGSRFNGFGGLSGLGGQSPLDFQRPIDLGGGGFNRPILTTIAPPHSFGTINPNRNIRFSKKK